MSVVLGDGQGELTTNVNEDAIRDLQNYLVNIASGGKPNTFEVIERLRKVFDLNLVECKLLAERILGNNLPKKFLGKRKIYFFFSKQEVEDIIREHIATKFNIDEKDIEVVGDPARVYLDANIYLD